VSHGLRPRPQPDAAVLAAVAVAVELLSRESAASAAPVDTTTDTTWRFSGRWFAAPTSWRRSAS